MDKTEDKGQKTEDGRRRMEDRGQKTEDGRQRTPLVLSLKSYVLSLKSYVLSPQSKKENNGITERNTGQNRFRRLDTENHECDENGVGGQAEE